MRAGRGASAPELDCVRACLVTAVKCRSLLAFDPPPPLFSGGKKVLQSARPSKNCRPRTSSCARLTKTYSKVPNKSHNSKKEAHSLRNC